MIVSRSCGICIFTISLDVISLNGLHYSGCRNTDINRTEKFRFMIQYQQCETKQSNTCRAWQMSILEYA